MTTSQKITRVIDPTPADSGRARTQNGWIDYHNKERKATMSASDVYSAPDSILRSLREDCKKSWLVTGTRISYNPADLSAKIIHDFGSTVVKPKETSLVVPVYRDEQVTKAAEGEGLIYLQTLFDTEDNASSLIGRLERISEKEAKDIRIWTPDQDSRREYSERAVGFGCIDGRFLVDGYSWFGGIIVGQARGVSVKSADKEKTK